jgi:hypothetical protein
MLGLPFQFRPAHTRLGFWLALGGLLGSLAGCGYALIGSSSGTPAAHIALAVVPFTNQTREPDLESRMTAALRRALVRSVGFDLASAATAPRQLQGVVRRFRIVPLSFDENDNALQYRIEADIFIRLVETTSQATTLEQEISTWAEYLVSNTVQENVVAKEAALFRLAQKFASQCTALLTVTLL